MADVILPRSDGRLADFLLGLISAECPRGHPFDLGVQLELDFDALAIMSFRETLSYFLRDFEERCPSCGRTARGEDLRQARFFYTFEDLAGTLIAWWSASIGHFEIGYHQEVRPDRLLANRPTSLRDLGCAPHSDLRNDDCRAALGRVFSIRSRWLEFIERFAQTPKTLVELAAPGLAIGLHMPTRAAEFRAILRVLLANYDPRDRHRHISLEDPHDRAPGTAHEWLTAEARRRLAEYHAVPIVVVDRWEAYACAQEQARRLGVELDGVESVRRGELTLPFDFDGLLTRAVRSCRTLGEQAYIDLAPAAATLARAHAIVVAARALGPAELGPDWTLRLNGRPVDLARLAETVDPETQEGQKILNDIFRRDAN